MSDQEKSRGWSRHPIIVVLITFLLSGILGTGFSQWLSKRSADAAQQRIEALNRKEAVQGFSRYVYERRARAEMLASSFRRNASIDEIKHRKILYDDAYFNWNSNHQANLLLIRDILGSSEYSFFEHSVESFLVLKIFKPIDICLTQAYDARLDEVDVHAIIDQCDIRRLLQEALDCGYAITDELYKLSIKSANQINEQSQINNRCPINP